MLIRTVIACLVHFLLATFAIAGDIYPTHFELGKVGRLPTHFVFKVKRILGENEMIFQSYSQELVISSVGVKITQSVSGFRENGPPIVLKDAPTKGLVDGKEITMPDIYKVVDTKMVLGRTVFVIAPATGDDRKKIEDEETEARKEALENAERKTKKKSKMPPKPENKEYKPDPEADASRKLKLAKGFLPEDKDGARRRLKEVIADYPATKAAAEAKEVLKRLKD
ncbi:MAG TPA: hypothetical protein VGY77_08045 [Gemmataceae bacterium]|nr:hypothetical protein [Gemmataceae bacterium]